MDSHHRDTGHCTAATQWLLGLATHSGAGISSLLGLRTLLGSNVKNVMEGREEEGKKKGRRTSSGLGL